MKKISILGSTGSIGQQAVEIVCQNKDEFQVSSLACHSRIDVLSKQIELLEPKVVFVGEEKSAKIIKDNYRSIEVINREDELLDLVEKDDYHISLNSIVGIAGLKYTHSAIRGGKTLALANKESLVTGGRMIMDMAKANQVDIIPVDSEHSAIFQSLMGNKKSQLRRILLTASGGPFRNKTLDQLANVSVEDALKHPNWSMGKKITIDSATLMNKGLELVEAAVLFDVCGDDIEVLVHPQSILHSAVEYIDGSVIGQLGTPDMKTPIRFALSYPQRLPSYEKALNFFEDARQLTFEKIDSSIFKTVDLSRRALREGHSYQIVLNGANEILVELFLKGCIEFLDIQKYIEKALDNHREVRNLDIEKIIEIDREVRRQVLSYIK